MKKLILLLIVVSISLLSHGQTKKSQKQIQMETEVMVLPQEAIQEKAIPVGSKYYSADVDGFALIFVDREGRIEVMHDIQKDVFQKTKDSSYDPMVKVIWDDELMAYRTAENLMEHRLEVDGERVVQKLLSEIVEYKRVKIE